MAQEVVIRGELQVVDTGARPDNTLPGDLPRPTHPIYYPPVYPAHPIIIPPDGIAPGVPAHPIYIPPGIWSGPWLPPYVDNTLPPPLGFWGGYRPPYVDNALPIPPGHPSHPIVTFPPYVDNSLPVPPDPCDCGRSTPQPGKVGMEYKLYYSPMYGWIMVPTFGER